MSLEDPGSIRVVSRVCSDRSANVMRDGLLRSEPASDCTAFGCAAAVELSASPFFLIVPCPGKSLLFEYSLVATAQCQCSTLGGFVQAVPDFDRTLSAKSPQMR